MMIFDIIKIKYVAEGFLPNYPYHLISDEEACKAFLNYPDDPSLSEEEAWEQFLNDDNVCWFTYFYGLPDPEFEDEYRELVTNIKYHIDKFVASNDDVKTLPDWVYSYMVGSSLSDKSSTLDLHDMLVSLGLDNIDDEFTLEAHEACYEISTKWLRKLPEDEKDHRSPTMFGDLSVLKYLRLLHTDLNV